MAEPTAVGAVDPCAALASGTARANGSIGSGGFLRRARLKGLAPLDALVGRI